MNGIFHWNPWVSFCLSKQAGLKVGQALPEKVKIVEVGPRDGLQNEKVMFAELTKLILYVKKQNSCK